jgi:hydroxyacyl-ACP dehydratase HTD2-like protein with hotdog domain
MTILHWDVTYSKQRDGYVQKVRLVVTAPTRTEAIFEAVHAARNRGHDGVTIDHVARIS